MFLLCYKSVAMQCGDAGMPARQPNLNSQTSTPSAAVTHTETAISAYMLLLMMQRGGFGRGIKLR